MPLETNVSVIEDLNPAWPTGTDFKSEGDDHLRNIKTAVDGSNEERKAEIALINNELDNKELITEWGNVSQIGNITPGSSGNFSVEQTSTGLYTFTWDNAATSNNQQVLLITPVWYGTDTVAAIVRNISPTVQEVEFRSGGNVAQLSNTVFGFMRIYW